MGGASESLRADSPDVVRGAPARVDQFVTLRIGSYTQTIQTCLSVGKCCALNKVAQTPRDLFMQQQGHGQRQFSVLSSTVISSHKGGSPASEVTAR